MSEGIAAFFMLVVFFVGAWVGGCAGRDGGYRTGQLDALDNKWHYQRITAADGRSRVIRLEQPATSQPTSAITTEER